MKRDTDFSMIPNRILGHSKLSVPARYLYCVLIKYCFSKKTSCFVTQKTLGKDTDYSERHIRTLLTELIKVRLVKKMRKEFNGCNYYSVNRELGRSWNSKSSRLGSAVPSEYGNTVPDNNTFSNKTNFNNNYYFRKTYRNRKRFRTGFESVGMITPSVY